MKRSSNPCPAWRESVCLLAGNSLPAGEQTEVQRHLAECAGCRAYFEEMKSLTAPLANWEKNVSGVQPDQMLRARWRKAVLAAADHQPAPQFSLRLALRTSWRELIRPCRYAWAAMAALWLMMVGINAAMSGGQRYVPDARSSAPSTTFQAFEEQRRVLAELIPPIIGQPTEPPRREYPHSRSQRKTRWSIG